MITKENISQSYKDLVNMYSSKLKLQKLAKDEQNLPEELSKLYQDSEKIKSESKVFQQDQKEKIKTSTAHELRNMSEEEIKDEIFNEYRQSYFVDRVMDELKPKYSFIPSNPYKTIVGIVEPEHVNPIAKKWKNNFRSVYGHEIMEDEQVEAKFQEYELGISNQQQSQQQQSSQQQQQQQQQQSQQLSQQSSGQK
ncbi:hypothetical protein PPERSA_01699 [Pseudocohnilembus persalinus]|uniref:Uncharacterized protein n=1 Tax=Pseudocohnilembus persalinus TaxID=266149 RepID=A0A0V0R1H3_PSEPJ|nr:hypothetical protein PPERSA_01699 [Pseudocohnilembus persalinus]|eukprot:KRX08154.1 hypothetical protein PPERSA_01699 [Pseudocohnilembus persalinus]